MNLWLDHSWFSPGWQCRRKGVLPAKPGLRDALDDVVVCISSFPSRQDINSKVE
jgi:hypothetical protein